MNLMPRIGLAYRLNDKTVIRGGAGTFFARLVGGILDDVYTGNGIYQVSDSLSNAALIAQGPVFPNVLAAPLTTITQGASTLDVLSPQPENAVFRTGDRRRRAADRQGHGSDRLRNLQPAESICTVRRILTLPRWARPSPTSSITLRNAGRHLHDTGLHRTAAELEFRRDLRGDQRRQQLVRRAGGDFREALRSRIPVVRRRTPGPTKSTTGRRGHQTRSSDSATLCGPTTANYRLRQRQRRARSAPALRLHVCLGAGIPAFQ